LLAIIALLFAVEAALAVLAAAELLVTGVDVTAVMIAPEVWRRS